MSLSVRISRMKGTAERQALPPAFIRGGGPRSGRGSPPAAAAGKASSVTASPCQLPQRGSRGRFAPFLPPAFMRGEGHAVAVGVPRRSGDGPLSHASRVGSPGERAAALCRAQPPQAALGAELCDLHAKSVQIVRAADCDPFVKKGQSPFLTVSAKGTAALSQFHATEIFPRIRILQVLPHFQTYHAAMAFL